MQARIEIGGPAGGELRAPSRAYRVELDCRIRVAILVQSGKGHHPPVAKSQNVRIPAAMRHVLRIGECVVPGFEECDLRLSVKWIVLYRSAVDERTAILEHDHTVAKHVPVNRELAEHLSGDRIEQ